jgi:hypothetical protein
MRYQITAKCTISLTTYVEADSADDAVANCEAEMPRLCYHCAANDGDGEWSLSGEIDGDPFDLQAEPDE